jgi:hypothetical protein
MNDSNDDMQHFPAPRRPTTTRAEASLSRTPLSLFNISKKWGVYREVGVAPSAMPALRHRV